MSRKTKADKLLALLKAHVNRWVWLPGVMAAGGSQYNARIYELRQRGHRIESLQQGERSWFRLIVNSLPLQPDPHPTPQPDPQPTRASTDLLFPLPPREWRDDG